MPRDEFFLEPALGYVQNSAHMHRTRQRTRWNISDPVESSHSRTVNPPLQLHPLSTICSPAIGQMILYPWRDWLIGIWDNALRIRRGRKKRGCRNPFNSFDGTTWSGWGCTDGKVRSRIWRGISFSHSWEEIEVNRRNEIRNWETWAWNPRRKSQILKKVPLKYVVAWWFDLGWILMICQCQRKCCFAF